MAKKIMNGLDWPLLLDRLAKYAQAERAKTLCYALEPLETLERAQQQLQDVEDAQICLQVQEMPWLGSLDNAPPVLEKLSKQATLEPKDLRELKLFLQAAFAVKALLKGFNNKWCRYQFSMLADFKPQISAIEHVITEAGEIKEDASETLWSLCEERRKLERSIKSTLDDVVKRRVMQSILQDRYVTSREGRWVLPVKSGSQHDMKGIIHDSSHTKQTVFMEPEEVVPLNNRLREVEGAILEEIQRILMQLTQYLFHFLVEFKNSDKTILLCDLTWAKARLGAALSAHSPVLSRTEIGLENLRHPLLVLQGEEVVPNTVKLDESRRILLLSGPNAGGKTILLKSIGLVAQMARCGLPIPCSRSSKIPFFKFIDPVVGDLQSVGDHLSSFSAHIGRLIGCLKYKDLSSLILIDEIAGATDPEEGSALARAFIEHFSKQKVFCVVTSHLGPLKESWTPGSGVIHGSLEFDMRHNQPTYKLLLGIPGRSLALAVAKRFGVPDDIINRAHDLLSPEGKARVKNLEEIEELKDQIMVMRQETERDRTEARDFKEQYQGLVRKFREQRDRWLERALQKAEKKIDHIIEETRSEKLEKKTLYDVKVELPEIVKGKPLKPRPSSPEEFVKQFHPGSPAFAPRLGRNVIVQSAPDNKGNVYVMADLMRLQMPWQQLHPVDTTSPAQKKGRIQATPGLKSSAGMSFMDNPEDVPEVLDLRGYRVDEAIESLEKWLDDCTRTHRERVKIIHGFGTEALKRALRQNLTRNKLVERWNAGDQNSGGDGVTWVQIRH